MTQQIFDRRPSEADFLLECRQRDLAERRRQVGTTSQRLRQLVVGCVKDMGRFDRQDLETSSEMQHLKPERQSIIIF